ncbi:hypothetical protein AB1Y20_010111 [Prymnesium parvum]|uniref:Uncharacterized protein n=1 Tax=Prymnesium parvum TaxID=97485 RepID=A0AB34K435_PRYPA
MDEEHGAPSHGGLREEDARVETPRLSAGISPTVSEQIEAQVPLLSLGWSAADEEKLKRDELRIQRLSELLDEREDRRREAVLVSLLERDRARAPLAPDTPTEGRAQGADHFAVPNICARTWESSSSPRAAEAVRVAWEGGASGEEAEALPERRAPAALPIHQPPAAARTPYRAVYPPSDTFEWVARSRASTAPPHSFSSFAADPMEHEEALRPSSLEDLPSADSFEAYLEELRLSARRAFERAPASNPLHGARHRTSALPPAIRARSPKDAADAIEAAAIAARLPSRSSAAQLEQRLRLELQVHEAMGQLERRVNEAHRLHADLGSNMHADAVREVYALSSARREEAEGAGIALLQRQLEAQQREHRERIAQIHSLGLASSVSGAFPVLDRASSGREEASSVEAAVGEIGDELLAHLAGELGGEVAREAMSEVIGEVAGGLIGELISQVTDELAREEVESQLAAAAGALSHASSNEESRASKSGSHSAACEGGITSSRAPSENGVSTHEPLLAALPGALEARRYSPADEAARGKPGALRLLVEGPPEQGDAVRYEVSVPAGVAPGSSFLASVGGRTVRVPVPLGIDPLVSLVIEMEPQPGLWVVDLPERAREGDSFHVSLAGEVRLVTVPGVGVEDSRRAGAAMSGVGLSPQRLTRRSRGARLSRVAYESESDGESRESGSSGESWTHAWAPRAASASEASVHAAPSIERELLRVLLEERQYKGGEEAELSGKVLSRISEQAQNTLSWSDIRQQEAAAEREAHKQLRALKAKSRKQVRHAEREIFRSLARRKAELFASQVPPAQTVDTLPTFRRDGTVLTDVAGDVEPLADVEPPACDGTLSADATDAWAELEAGSQGSTLRQASERRDDDALAISSGGGDDALDAAAAQAKHRQMLI